MSTQFVIIWNHMIWFIFLLWFRHFFSRLVKCWFDLMIVLSIWFVPTASIRQSMWSFGISSIGLFVCLIVAQNWHTRVRMCLDGNHTIWKAKVIIAHGVFFPLLIKCLLMTKKRTNPNKEHMTLQYKYSWSRDDGSLLPISFLHLNSADIYDSRFVCFNGHGHTNLCFVFRRINLKTLTNTCLSRWLSLGHNH